MGGEVSVLVTLTGQDIHGSQVENQDLVYSWTTNSVIRLSDQLVLTSSQPFGQFALTIGCVAMGMFATADSESATLIEYADDRLTQWNQQFYNDREACLAPILQAINRRVKVHIPFWIAMTFPRSPARLLASGANPEECRSGACDPRYLAETRETLGRTACRSAVGSARQHAARVGRAGSIWTN